VASSPNVRPNRRRSFSHLINVRQPAASGRSSFACSSATFTWHRPVSDVVSGSHSGFGSPGLGRSRSPLLWRSKIPRQGALLGWPARAASKCRGDAFEIGGVKEGVGPQSAGLPMRRAIPAECRSAAAGRHRADERTYPRVDSRAAPDPAAVRGAHSLLLRPFSSVPAPVEQDSGAARQANPGRMGVRGAARAQAPCVVAP